MTADDKEDIRELTALYARAIDTRDYDGIAACFADDAVAQYNGFSLVLTGRDEITAHMRKCLDPLEATQHMFTNFIIRGDSVAAQLNCDIIAQHVQGADGQRQTYLAGGRYTVELRKDAGQWRFARLGAQSVWSMGSRELLPHAA